MHSSIIPENIRVEAELHEDEYDASPLFLGGSSFYHYKFRREESDDNE